MLSSHILSANKLISFHPLSQGPFVHVASLCAALLSKFMAALFGGIFMVRMVTTFKKKKRLPDMLMHTFWVIKPLRTFTVYVSKPFLINLSLFYPCVRWMEWKTHNCVFTVVSALYSQICRNIDDACSVLQNVFYVNSVQTQWPCAPSTTRWNKSTSPTSPCRLQLKRNSSTNFRKFCSRERRLISLSRLRVKRMNPLPVTVFWDVSCRCFSNL